MSTLYVCVVEAFFFVLHKIIYMTFTNADKIRQRTACFIRWSKCFSIIGKDDWCIYYYFKIVIACYIKASNSNISQQVVVYNSEKYGFFNYIMQYVHVCNVFFLKIFKYKKPVRGIAPPKNHYRILLYFNIFIIEQRTNVK